MKSGYSFNDSGILFVYGAKSSDYMFESILLAYEGCYVNNGSRQFVTRVTEIIRNGRYSNVTSKYSMDANRSKITITDTRAQSGSGTSTISAFSVMYGFVITIPYHAT